jgi:hypothetical protein
MDESHALEPFLTKRLTELGLDYETYGPYVLPLLEEFEHADEDEWANVMELLQASSESHSEDEQAWKDLRVDIEAAWKMHRDDMVKQEKQELKLHHQEMNETLEKERQRAVEAAAILEEEKKAKKTETSKDDGMSEAKRALISRYAFEEDADNEEEEDAPLTNQKVAALAAQERSADLKSKNVVTKKDEQQKTAKAKMEKAQVKEERRQRSTKLERKR